MLGQGKKRRASPKSALIKLGLAKRRVMVEDVGSVEQEEEEQMASPQILNVWSCTESSMVLQPGLGEIALEGPVVKQEPREEEERQQQYHEEQEELDHEEQEEHDHEEQEEQDHEEQEEQEEQETEDEEDEEDEEVPQINLTAMLSESMMSNQLLELIDSTLYCGTANSVQEEEEQEEQQPTNYNDPPSPSDTDLVAQSVLQELQEPVMVSRRELLLMQKREKLSSLLLLPRSQEVQEQVERVSLEIHRLRQEVERVEQESKRLEQERQEQDNSKGSSHVEGEVASNRSMVRRWSHEVGLKRSGQVEEGRRPSQEQEVSDRLPSQETETLDPWQALQRVQGTEEQELGMRREGQGTTSWAQYKERAAARPQLPAPTTAPTSSPALRGCLVEALAFGLSREQEVRGTLTFSLMRDYSGSCLQWRSFLCLGASLHLQLGRAGQVFYLRGLLAATTTSEEDSLAWRLQLLPTSEAKGVSLGGTFSCQPTPYVLPLDIRQGDLRNFLCTVTRGT